MQRIPRDQATHLEFGAHIPPAITVDIGEEFVIETQDAVSYTHLDVYKRQVCHRSGDKVHPDRPRRVRAQLDQLQAVAPDLQGKRCLAVELQPEPLCIGCRQKIKRGV